MTKWQKRKQIKKQLRKKSREVSIASARSRTNQRSRQQTREMTQLEALGEEIIQAPPDGSTLRELLAKHIDRMFRDPNDILEIRIFEGIGAHFRPGGAGVIEADAVLADRTLCTLGPDACVELIRVADRAAHPSAQYRDRPRA